MRSRLCLTNCFCFLSLVALVGCGGSSTYKVSGTVKYKDGTPVPAASITFNPSTPSEEATVGQVKDGKYSLKTGDKEGAPAGTYKVTLGAPAPSLELSDPHAIQKMADMQGQKAPVAAKYTDKGQTPLAAEIKGDKSDLDFEVEKP